jgi:hypothetical protein
MVIFPEIAVIAAMNEMGAHAVVIPIDTLLFSHDLPPASDNPAFN